MNTIGNVLRLTSYGESHGPAIGAVLDGFPSGFKLDLDAVQAQLNRRRPGQSSVTTPRKEQDQLQLNSGLFEGVTTGAPIHMFIENADANSKDYSQLKDVYRPSHADFTYEQRYGHRDYRGGGRSSARVTAAWVAAGAMAQDYLEKELGVQCVAYVEQIGTIKAAVSGFYDRHLIDASVVRCPDPAIAKEMVNAVDLAREESDSLGGVIRLVVQGLEAGIGNPVFDKLSAKMGHAMLSINAVKGFEIGGGFDMAGQRGSEVNDAFENRDGNIETKTNFSGGIQGGISNGMNLDFRIAFKPTASIGSAQQSVNTDGQEVEVQTHGRHDPCVLPRAVPIVESMAALVVLDAVLSS